MAEFQVTPVDHDPFAEPPAAQPGFRLRGGVADAPSNGRVDIGASLGRDFSRLVDGISGAFDTVGNSLMGKTSVEVGPNGEVSPMDPSLIDAGNVLGGLVMEGGLASPRPGNSLGVFGGPRAQNADLFKLMRAQRLEGMGAPAEHTFAETGWFRGVDGKWRFEIPDAGAGLDVNSLAARSATLGSVMDHPELFAAYPSLKNVKVTDDVPQGAGGVYDPIGNEVGVKDAKSLANAPVAQQADAMSILLHETQHAIQSREDFAHGGSPDDPQIGYLGMDLASRVDQRLVQLADKRAPNAGGNGPGLTDEERQEWVYLNGISGKLHRNYGQTGYHALAGEVEARNVQTRYDLDTDDFINPGRLIAGSPYTRTNETPLATMDVPAALQLTRFMPQWARSPNALIPGIEIGVK